MGDRGDVRLGARFDEAVGFAAEVHRDDVRKGSAIPYVSHLLAACSLTLEDGGSEDEAIAALLHDTVEDHGAELLEVIERRFGPAVASVVAGCSDVLDVEEGGAKPPWRERKECYLAHLEEAGPSVLRVSNADKLHNARAILADYRRVGEGLWGRFNPAAASADAQLWYLASLSDVFTRRRPGSFLPVELRATVDELRRLVDRAER